MPSSFNQAQTSISQISSVTQVENMHRESINIEQISPVKDADDLDLNLLPNHFAE